MFKLEGNFAIYKNDVWFIKKKNDDGKFTILNADNSKKTVNGSELTIPTFDQIRNHITLDILQNQIIPKIEEYDAEYQKQTQPQTQTQSQTQTRTQPVSQPQTQPQLSFFSKVQKIFGKKGGNSKTQKQDRKPKKRSITNKSSSNKKNKSIKKHLKQ